MTLNHSLSVSGNASPITIRTWISLARDSHDKGGEIKPGISLTNCHQAFVEEKELRIKEGMRIVGLFGSSHFFSWFTCYGIVSLVSI